MTASRAILTASLGIGSSPSEGETVEMEEKEIVKEKRCITFCLTPWADDQNGVRLHGSGEGGLKQATSGQTVPCSSWLRASRWSSAAEDMIGQMGEAERSR